ncbi:MAG: hypothetical protein AAFV43_13105 [Planctomycetota bacterium]
MIQGVARHFVGAALLVWSAGPAWAVQIVTLDFDTFTTPDIEPEDHVYTPDDRAEILGLLNDIFRTDPMDPAGGAFGVTFEVFDPADPPVSFSTSIVKFNAGAFGAAEGIDFRNQDDDDDVTVNANGVLGLFVGSARSPELGGGVWTAEELGSPEAIVFASAQIAAHELGHALGLRHHDGFGPIGSGIGVSPASYSPTYPGPAFIGLTSQHIMSLNSSVALTANTLLTPSHFSERSALKLTLAAAEGEIGPNPFVVSESEYPMGDGPDLFIDAFMAPVPLFEAPVPNTLESPHEWAPIHGGPDSLPAAAGIVTGSIEPRPGDASDTDYYSLVLDEPARVTIEVISEQNVNTTDVVDPFLVVLDATTALPIAYEGGEAFSNDQFESTDAILFDLGLAAGTYVLEVFSAVPDDVGDYELLVYAFPDVEFPLIGDYNDDLVVDVADYTVWRDAEGVEDSLPNRTPGLTGLVGAEDYDGWAGNFGEFSLDFPGGGSATSVPEPSVATLALVAGMACLSTQARR